MSTPLTLSTVFSEEPVVIDGATFLLKEMSGVQRDLWLSRMAARTKTDGKGNPTGVKDFTGIFSGLICLCLRDPQGNMVSEVTVNNWPAKIQKVLFERCQEMNGLSVESEEQVKND